MYVCVCVYMYIYKALCLVAEKDTEGLSSTEVMLGKAVLACALLLMVLEPLLTLPITQLADMSYTGPGEYHTHTHTRLMNRYNALMVDFLWSQYQKRSR